MNKNNGDLNALIEEKLQADTEFQNTLVDLTDEDKEKAISEKKSEIINTEWSTLQEDLKKKEELATNYKIRAEKAEKSTKKEDNKAGEGESPKTNASEDKKDLSSKDLLVLVNAKVNTDDVDEIVEYAKFKNITIEEALKSDIIKTTLVQKEEQRKVANGTNTGGDNGGRKGNYKSSDESILGKAEKGELPESESDIKRLTELNLKKGRK